MFYLDDIVDIRDEPILPDSAEPKLVEANILGRVNFHEVQKIQT